MSKVRRCRRSWSRWARRRSDPGSSSSWRRRGRGRRSPWRGSVRRTGPCGAGPGRSWRSAFSLALLCVTANQVVTTARLTSLNKGGEGPSKCTDHTWALKKDAASYTITVAKAVATSLTTATMAQNRHSKNNSSSNASNSNNSNRCSINNSNNIISTTAAKH